jgi:hypothetical protein
LSQPQGRQLVRWVVLWRHALLQPLHGYISGQVRRPRPPLHPPLLPPPSAPSGSSQRKLLLRLAPPALVGSLRRRPARAPCDRLRHPRSQPRHKDTWRSP